MAGSSPGATGNPLCSEADAGKVFRDSKSSRWTSDKKIAHYAIVKMNDLYYFNDFPFPYLESIVLYYKKYKFKDTKLTNQAFLEPYLRTQQTKRKSSRSLISSSMDDINNDTIEHDKTWTYGHYKSLSTRL
ncbi:uncharacterized protein TNCV_3234361 [Trichonephila clavipes]|nr:uncharacterized protein TNCV_3234361 [Trichonephila clavipes]